MHIILHKIEKLVDKLIPFCLVVLLGVIIIHFFFEDIAYQYKTTLFVTDSLIVATFVLDLIFKYIRMRNIPKFLRTYWLDIIAVLPFYAAFRFADEVMHFFNPVAESVHSSQMVLHEGLRIEKEGAKIIREVGETSRYQRFLRFVLPRITRLPRLARVISFFEKPTGTHHNHDKKPKSKRVKKKSK